MKKQFLFIFMILFSLLFVSMCSAASVTLYEQSGDAGYQAYLLENDPSDSSDPSRVGIVFQVHELSYLDYVDVTMRNVGTTDGDLVLVLCNVTGSAGQRLPTTDIEFSDVINALSITIDPQTVRFTFSGDVLLSYEGWYGVYLLLDNSTNAVYNTHRLDIFSGNNPSLGDNSISYHFAGSLHWNFGTFHSFFTVIGDTLPNTTPTPSPSPVATVHVNNAGVEAVPSYYMIILVLFAVVAVLAGIYVGFERDGGNKGVAFLFALVALVIFVVLIVGYLAG